MHRLRFRCGKKKLCFVEKRFWLAFSRTARFRVEFHVATTDGPVQNDDLRKAGIFFSGPLFIILRSIFILSFLCIRRPTTALLLDTVLELGHKQTKMFKWVYGLLQKFGFFLSSNRSRRTLVSVL